MNEQVLQTIIFNATVSMLELAKKSDTISDQERLSMLRNDAQFLLDCINAVQERNAYLEHFVEIPLMKLKVSLASQDIDEGYIINLVNDIGMQALERLDQSQ